MIGNTRPYHSHVKLRKLPKTKVFLCSLCHSHVVLKSKQICWTCIRKAFV